jgi:hypothetical protein
VQAVKSSSHAELQLKERTFGWVVRRLLLYIGLAVAALTVFALFFALSIHLGITDKITGGWIGFVGYTGLLFLITVRQSKRRWPHWSFWLVIACLLTIHSLAFVAILRIYPEWRMIWFWPTTVAEAGMFGGTLAWLFPERRPKLKGDEEL